MSGEDYLSLADIAQAAGVSQHDLHVRFWPAAWGSPHHFYLPRRSSTVRVRAASVADIAALLREGGLTAQAEALTAWHARVMATIAPPAAAPVKPWERRMRGLRRVERRPAPVIKSMEPAEPTAQTMRDITSWQAQWEARHDQ